MVILLLFFLLLIAIIALYLLFRLIKWSLRLKTRSIWMLSILGIFILAAAVNKLFFERMEFIQSNVYPNVYLIKNKISDTDSLRTIIKEMVSQKMYNQINGKEEILKTRYKYSDRRLPSISASIRFYEYYDTWGIIPFGEAGTAHFLENKENLDGFSSELLQHYQLYRIAEFSLRYCKNDTINFFGNLNYFEDGIIIKTDSLFNACERMN